MENKPTSKQGNRNKPNKINREIRADVVRLIGDDGVQLGILPLQEALSAATSKELDLVEINSQSSPIVCKIMDYGKYLYEKKKSLKLQKKRHKPSQMKEIKFRPATDIGDYHLKIKNIIKFLEHGDRVKVSVNFRGREVTHQQLGRDLLDRVKVDLQDVSILEAQHFTTDSKQFHILLAPKKK